MKATISIAREKKQRFHTEHYTEMRGVFHFHSSIELLLVEEGEAEVWIDGAASNVRAGELAVVLSYAAHRFISVGTGAFTILFIPTLLCPDFMDAIAGKKVSSPFVRDKKAMARILYAVDALRGESLNAVEQGGYLRVILGTVLGSLGMEQAEDGGELALPAKLFFYINEHYKESISAESIAAALGYSRHHLSKSFRARFHVGIGEYINTLRLKNAVVLMREHGKSVTECALESGFGSLRTFYRVFTQEFGCSPRDYINRD